ncbi:MAG: c-type cytochrome [Acidimicrobiales bacterium]
MTEVPEHLLARSKARRAALGLGGDAGGGEAEAPAAAPATESAAVEKATPSAPAKAAATPATATPKEPEPLPPYVEAAMTRKKIPVWAMPVILFLPLWGILYAQTLSAAPTKEKTQLELGAEVYAAKCASCHGSTGGGGVGRPLANGEVLKTFPTIDQQMEFIHVGTDGFAGQGYGNPNREGGQHIAGSFGAKMPAFLGALTDAELLAVARHERETLGGEKPDAKQIDATGALLHPDGKPYLSTTGALVSSDGKELFDKAGRLTAPIAQESAAG